MSAPVAHVRGHDLPLDTMVCSCGEWAAEGDGVEFRRAAFDCWRAHAAAFPLAPVEVVRAPGSQWLHADAGSAGRGLILVLVALASVLLLAPIAFAAGKATRTEIGTACTAQLIGGVVVERGCR